VSWQLLAHSANLHISKTWKQAQHTSTKAGGSGQPKGLDQTYGMLNVQVHLNRGPTAIDSVKE